MANLAIVAIPSDDDYVWKISSEKVPHMTLLFLGDAMSNPNVMKISEFLEHAVNFLKLGPFGMEVDHRGTLGEDDADVVFFRKDWSAERIEEFRGQLLKNEAVRKAYDSVEQYPEWNPHLTLGYPSSPAREDTREYPGIRWIQFDRIALWFGEYEGPEFRLTYNYYLPEVAMSTEVERGAEFIAHFGVKGMRWGVRNQREVSVETRTDVGLVKRQTRIKVAGGEAHPASTDAVKVAVQTQKLKRSGVAALSNQELREVATRIQLEEQVKTLTTRKGKKFARRQLETQGQQQIQRGLQKGVSKGVSKAGKLAVGALI